MNQPIVHFTILFLTSHEGFKFLKQYSKLHITLKEGPLSKLETEGCSDFYKKMANYYNHSVRWFYLNWFLYRFRKSIKPKYNKFYMLELLV